MGSLQQRRTDSGLCRTCGNVVDRKPTKNGLRAVYCKRCLVESKADSARRVAERRKQNEVIAAQLRPFGYDIPGEVK
jgi:late competence protein required for DNA uptake (superfamily II DNA/RNA helicase)